VKPSLWLLFACSLPAWGWCQTDDQCRSGSRSAFLDVERVARQSEDAQREQIPRLYRETCSEAREYLAHLRPYSVPSGEALSVEDLAARIEREAGWGWLAEAARRRCADLFGRHRAMVRSLVLADFHSATPEGLRRACRTVGELRLWELFPEAVEVLQTAPEELADLAAYALRDLNDPRAIEPLIRKDPQRPTRYFELLRFLQRNRPPHPLLVGLLKTEDATVRRQAAYALEEAIAPK